MPLPKGWAHAIVAKKGTIAMSQQHQAQHGERDRVGRILARQSRVATRIARTFDDPNGRLAQEVADILAHMPHREDDARFWHIAPQKGPVDW